MTQDTQTPQPGWLKREAEKLKQEVASWPQWLKDEAGIVTEQTPQPEKTYNYKQTQAIHMQWQMRELREGVKRATLEELAQIPMHETPDIFMPEGFWRACSCCDVMNTVLYSTYAGFAFCALCIGKAAGL